MPFAMTLLRVVLFSLVATLAAPSYVHVSQAFKKQRSRAAAAAGPYGRSLVAVSSSKKDGDKEKGYKFGDLSRGIAMRFTSSVNKVTGKETYQFGDLSRYLDEQAKAEASKVVGKDYELGDLSKWIDTRIKDKMKERTGGNTYEFGDLSKEIVRRTVSGENNLQDVALLCKSLLSFGVGLSPVAGFLPVKVLTDAMNKDVSKQIARRAIYGEYKLQDLALLCKARLLSFGIGLSPVAGFLPVKVLINLLNYSLTADLGERFVGAITLEIDRRMKELVTGNPDYKLGDYTKAGILDFIGKEEYSFGDITKTVLTKMDEADDAKGKGTSSSLLAKSGDKLRKEEQGKKSEAEIASTVELTDPRILAELDEWDNALKATKAEIEKAKECPSK